MDSSLDPLEHVFLEGMAIRDAHDHARAMIASVLDRQSLTEMPVDYSRGLKDALKLAKDCKVHSLTHSSMQVAGFYTTTCSTNILATALAGSVAC